jgi:hypothetical protein
MSLMDRRSKAIEYLKAEGFAEILGFDYTVPMTGQNDVFTPVSADAQVPLAPEPEDLARLHQLIRRRRVFTVLEFGVGYSTTIIADALEKNEKEWRTLKPVPAVRNRFMFQVFSVDASEQWIRRAREQIPASLANRVHMQLSDVAIGTFNGQLCHFYKSVPDIVPDFIYLDGPSPKDVRGAIHGMTFLCDERTVMSGDLLLMEPTLLPGTLILVDGRTNNARFLANNFRRKYEIQWDREGDVTTFELTEPRVGPFNVLGTDFF